MAQFNGFGNSEKFPFSIERKFTDSDDYYKGICQGAMAIYEMLKMGMFEDNALTTSYFSHDIDRSVSYERYMINKVNEEDKDFADEIYEEGFDDGFKHGYQSACEDAETDIYIDTEKICKLDQLHNDLLELGKTLRPWDIDKLNAVLKRVMDLKYDVAKDAVDDYLGYK